jgi:iron(III) transport system substrate-binding protein
MELYKENFAVLAQPGIAKPQTELPADYEQRLFKNDFAWASKNRDEILTEWRKRYDGKSEKVAAK